tara:strand:+ start:66 stop:533 length:468 start_codon:yes stop_codon:yes gene_type:complete
MITCEDHRKCITNAMELADQICEEKQLKFTNLRRDVLRMIWERHAPQKAYDLLDKLQATNRSAKPATVYRTLDFLKENGFIHKVKSLNAFVGCSHPLKHAECYFLICDNCKEINECCDGDITSAINTMTKKNRFFVKNATVEIAGRCNECSKIAE